MVLEGKVKKGLGNASFWVEKIEEYLPQDVLRINIKKDTEDDSKRNFSFHITSER